MLFQSGTVMALSVFLAPFRAEIARDPVAINPWGVVVIFLLLVVIISLMILGNRQAPSIEPIVSHSHGHDQETHATGLE